jgi:hypothetical protein
MPVHTGPTVLFVIPCGDYLPSGTVRVRQFLPFLDRLGIGYTVLSYFSPRIDRFDAFVHHSGAPSLSAPATRADILSKSNGTSGDWAAAR